MRQLCTNLETAWYCFVILGMSPCSSHGTWTLDTPSSISPVVPTSFSLAPRRETPSAFKSFTSRSGAKAETSIGPVFQNKWYIKSKSNRFPTHVSLGPKVFLRADLHILWIHFYANFGCVVSRCWAPGATATPMRLSSLSVCPAVDVARLVPESQRTRSSGWRILDFSGMCSQNCVAIEWFLFE